MQQKANSEIFRQKRSRKSLQTQTLIATEYNCYSRAHSVAGDYKGGLLLLRCCQRQQCAVLTARAISHDEQRSHTATVGLTNRQPRRMLETLPVQLYCRHANSITSRTGSGCVDSHLPDALVLASPTRNYKPIIVLDAWWLIPRDTLSSRQS